MQNYSKLNKLPTIVEEDETDRGDGYNGPTFRCSVQKMYSVISQFDQQKREIVNSMGWGGTLSMPLISNLSVRHMVWLLGMVDEVRQAIVLGPNKVFKFNESDVEKVFGIPAAGTDVMDRTLDRSDTVYAYLRGRLGIENKEVRSLKSIQSILSCDYKGKMSQTEVAAFKTAYIVFMMTHVFAPTVKNDYFYTDYWPALVDPDSLDKFNWGRYIVEVVCAAAVKMKQDIRRKATVSNIIGCLFILNVKCLKGNQ
ncbi:unnamed protein product [Triticum aestivum]|uniref:Uncharacterized protein n=1 Tax=Triticum aestivum TaxID=4565 RepID=A0A7H4LAY0_WHEAT|nr:unnamed protein product [Triticum aestivum]